MPGRSAAQLSRTPGQWHDHQAQERGRQLAALLPELDRARASGAEWYRWALDRAAGEHRHGLRDDRGAVIACPVGGCDHERGAVTPHLPSGAKQRQRERGRPSS